MKVETLHRHLKFFGILLAATLLLAGCGRRTGKLGAGLEGSVEPDRVLYERALEDIEKSRYIAARLNLMTLINTYPDSEFLAKAKLAVADSYYKEGGTAGLTLAVQEYKDFITFFPFLEEAPYAQFQVGMAHYRRLEKPDRDRTQARLAELEFQEFIKKFPEHEWVAQAEQRLREVQEVLAEGDYRIARYYYIKGSYRAAGGRLIEITDRYPLYSNADRSLMMLGDIFEKSERADFAARFYSRVIREYPLSEYVTGAKERLEVLGVPIPQPDPAAIERMQKEQAAAANKEGRGMFGKLLGFASARPDVSMAAATGQPTLESPTETTATLESLRPSQNFNLQGGAAGSSGGAAGGGVRPDNGERTNDPGAESAPTGDIPLRVDPKTGKEIGKEEKDKKDGKKKDDKESSSKKKKTGIKKLIPW